MNIKSVIYFTTTNVFSFSTVANTCLLVSVGRHRRPADQPVSQPASQPARTLCLSELATALSDIPLYLL